ncbi:MAG: hypothetical protein ACRERS_08040, partial [Methylococcales bacterium]
EMLAAFMEGIARAFSRPARNAIHARWLHPVKARIAGIHQREPTEFESPPFPARRQADSSGCPS